MAPIEVLLMGSCLRGLPEILTLAHALALPCPDLVVYLELQGTHNWLHKCSQNPLTRSYKAPKRN